MYNPLPKPSARPKIFDAAVLLVVGGLSLYAWNALRTRGQGAVCLARCDGRPVARYDLTRPGVFLDTLALKTGTLLVETRGGAFRVLRASCPNKVCVNRGAIRRRGESLVCVPNRFVALIPRKDGDVDAPTY